MYIQNVKVVVVKRKVDFTMEDGKVVKAYEVFDNKGGHWVDKAGWRRELIKMYSKGTYDNYDNMYDTRLVMQPGETVSMDYYTQGQGEIIVKNKTLQFDIVDGELKQTVIAENPHTIHLSFKKKQFYLEKQDGKEYFSKQGIIRYFKLADKAICEDDKIHVLLSMMLAGSKARTVNNMYYNWFKEFNYNVWMQILAYANFDYNFLIRIIEFKRSYINTKGKNPLEILELTKQELKYFRLEGGDFSTYQSIKRGLDIKFYSDLKKEVKKYPGDNRLYECDAEYISKILGKGYDFKTLVRYLAFDIRRYQGICSFHEGCRLLHDTLRMIEDLGGTMMEKYPKSLKKIHDLTIMDYRIKEDEIIDKKVKEKCASDNYKGNMFEDENYKIITPNGSKDLMREGQEMHHCVASYVSDVANGLTKIYFLRRKEDEDNSFVTIEVKDSNVIQCKAKFNSKPCDSAMKFIKEWCKEKDLTFIGY